MSVHRSGSPLFDYAMWDKEQQEWEAKLPHCECCGEPIDDRVWNIVGEILCDDCAREKYMRDVEDYLE